jgi:hypothetical protein
LCSGWRVLWLFGFGCGPGYRGKLRAKEIDFAFKPINGISRPTERVAGTVPDDHERNCKNNDQKEFHKQLVGL